MAVIFAHLMVAHTVRRYETLNLALWRSVGIAACFKYEVHRTCSRLSALERAIKDPSCRKGIATGIVAE